MQPAHAIVICCWHCRKPLHAYTDPTALRRHDDVFYQSIEAPLKHNSHSPEHYKQRAADRSGECCGLQRIYRKPVAAGCSLPGGWHSAADRRKHQ